MTTKPKGLLMFQSSNSQQNPWLMVSHMGKRKSSGVTTFYSILERNYYAAKIPDLNVSDKLVQASCCGWLVIRDAVNKPLDCILLNLVSMEKINLLLPTSVDLKQYEKARCILTAPPTEPDSILFFFSSKKPRAAIWFAAGNNWVEQKYGSNRLTNVTLCNGKMYGFQQCAAAACEMVDGKLTITRFRTIPKPEPEIQMEIRYLVGARGDIFWIRMVVGDHSLIVRYVDVFKFNQETSRWNKVRDIGNDVFFVNDNSSLSCSTENSTIKGNCIYFTLSGKDRTLYTYNMEDGRISRCLPFPNAVHHRSPPQFVMA